MTSSSAPAAFDFSAMDAAYRPPNYLRAPFREYLYSFDKGVYWLRTPAATGKTMFVRGLNAKRLGKDQKTTEGIDSNIATGMRAVAVHLRSGVCATPRQFVEALNAAFDAEFNLDEAERPKTAASIRYGDLTEARADLLAWLQRLRDVAAEKGATRLLLAIDGLEQIPAGSAAEEGYTIIDLLPGVSEIPANFILLLTSRPADAWVPELFEQAALKFGGGHGFMVRDITLNDDTYEKMLRLYFWDTVRPMFRSRALAHLEQLLENKARLATDKDARMANDVTFRDTLKSDWKKLTNKHPRYSMNQLPVGDLKQTLDEIDKLWADTMDRADRRFAYVSLILTNVAGGSLALDSVSALPKGEAMLASFEAPPAQ